MTPKLLEVTEKPHVDFDVCASTGAAVRRSRLPECGLLAHPYLIAENLLLLRAPPDQADCAKAEAEDGRKGGFGNGRHRRSIECDAVGEHDSFARVEVSDEKPAILN